MLLELAEKYGLYEEFVNAMFYNIMSTYEKGKSSIKLRIKEHDQCEWKSSCMMYNKLRHLYFSAQCNISSNVWYKVTNALPHLSRNISNIMALIMGCQPKGMQHNFEMLPCPLCELNENDSPTHVLFKCKSCRLQQTRENQWPSLLSVMPPVMAMQVNNFSDHKKTTYLLTGLSGGYVAEWLPVYSSISVYITQMYSLRNELYRDSQ